MLHALTKTPNQNNSIRNISSNNCGTGIAGVYDIETHYQYEYGRGVAELSTMKRAIGGRHKFQSQSPSLILNTACGNKAKVKWPDQATGCTAETTIGSR